MKFTFKELYKAAKETIEKAKEPFVKKSNIAAYDSFLAKLGNAILEKENERFKLYESIKEGKTLNPSETSKIRMDIKDLKGQMKATIEEAREFFEMPEYAKEEYEELKDL